MSETLELLRPDVRMGQLSKVSVRVSWSPAGFRWRSVAGNGLIYRALDIAIALTALLLLAPFMAMIVPLVWLSGGPILFGHRRVGMDGKTFTCWKFRTMYVDSDRILHEVLSSCAVSQSEWARDHKLRRDPRVTMIGALLRKTSLDELPQLFNVVSGSMSMVGPRPIVQAEAFRYGRYFADYCKVRPGITGLWQVSGRNGTTYRRRVACDVIYIRSKIRSKVPINDLRIMLKTIPAVCMARGAY